MIKKIFISIILILFIIQYTCFADEIENEDLDLSALEVSGNITNAPTINSKYAIVMEKTTQTVLYEKSSYTKTAMASTTKIMTAIIAIENCDLKEQVDISKKASSTGGSTLGIKENTTLSLETLLYGLLLRSRK
jgi:D-alanyl-D-alanine carboxypeptidase (penicillin-binding protein 5/6)